MAIKTVDRPKNPPPSAGLPKAEPATEGRMGLIGHLEELRSRIFISVGAWLAAAIAVYLYTPRLLPLVVVKEIGKLVFLSPTEAFMVHIKLALIGGAFLALPVILTQVILFLLPALTPSERKACFLIVPFALISFTGGAWFAVAVLLPAGLKFLLSFSGPALAPMISLGSYISFVFYMAAGGGFVFEMPLVMTILGKAGIVRSKFLCTYRRHAALIILLLAAVLTPSPDIFTQLLLAVPMYLLFEISIWLVRFVEPSKESKGPSQNGEIEPIAG